MSRVERPNYPSCQGAAAAEAEGSLSDKLFLSELAISPVRLQVSLTSRRYGAPSPSVRELRSGVESGEFEDVTHGQAQPRRLLPRV